MDEPRVRTCPRCGETITIPVSWNHQTNIYLMICPKCDYSFEDKEGDKNEIVVF